MYETLEVLSIPQVAKSLSISQRQVFRLLELGQLPSFCIGRRRLVRAKTLSEFVQHLEANASRQAA